MKYERQQQTVEIRFFGTLHFFVQTLQLPKAQTKFGEAVGSAGRPVVGQRSCKATGTSPGPGSAIFFSGERLKKAMLFFFAMIRQKHAKTKKHEA